MKTPVVVVTLTLAAAILLAASLLIATGTRGEDAPRPLKTDPAGRIAMPHAGENDTGAESAAPSPFRYHLSQ